MEYTVVCLQGCCSSPLSGAFTPPALVVIELVFSSPRCAPCLQQENFHLSVQSGVPRKQVRTKLTFLLLHSFGGYSIALSWLQMFYEFKKFLSQRPHL